MGVPAGAAPAGCGPPTDIPARAPIRTRAAAVRLIASRFLAEFTALAAPGGLIGTVLGVGTVLGTAPAEHWTAAPQPLVVLPGRWIGAAIGLLAGPCPVLRAARTRPLEALSR